MSKDDLHFQLLINDVHIESVVIVNKFILRLLTVVEKVRFGVHLSPKNVLYKMSIDSAVGKTT